MFLIDARRADLLDGVVGVASVKLSRVGKIAFGLVGNFLVFGAEIGLVLYEFLRSHHVLGFFCKTT